MEPCLARNTLWADYRWSCLMKEVDAVTTVTARAYRNGETAHPLVVARSLLLLNRPEEALAKVESVLIARARSYESK
jgi:hypothetical protein